MDSIHIQGGVALQGNVRIQGSKNAALPILAATLLAGERSLIRNCPRIADVHAMLELLKCLGCSVHWQADGVVVDPAGVRCGELDRNAVTGMRSSMFLLGALLGKCNEIVMEYPGGCVIGKRPIDMHIKALKRMGVEFEEKGGKLKGFAGRLHGAYICLPYPSVGVTENVILAGVMAEGETYLCGAAREPEIEALCRYLCKCGARIDGIGTNDLIIHGGRKLYGAEFEVPADRIVAGTYLYACIGTGGNVFLEHAPGKDMEAVLEVAEQMGAKLYSSPEGIYVQAPERPLPVNITTKPYPGFPTDLQSVVLAVETLGAGESHITETIFEDRFRIVSELERMGACIETLDSQKVRVRGVETLRGCPVKAGELRGGAALVVAGLMAENDTYVKGYSYIYRGYENICNDFRELGARVISV